MNKNFIGKWKITEMELWDSDYIDLVEPGFISFDDGGHGEFMFGVVKGYMRYGHGQNIVHFKWEGSDEGDEIRGEGWAELDENSTDILSGSIEFWDGDESEFKARKILK
ncbi:MAG: hypothetical protein KAJ86_03630 [Alphaproteobacteria bacterium]|nr:hypothetical protein [Alphaproteobacteria bacterium]